MKPGATRRVLVEIPGALDDCIWLRTVLNNVLASQDVLATNTPRLTRSGLWTTRDVVGVFALLY